MVLGVELRVVVSMVLGMESCMVLAIVPDIVVRMTPCMALGVELRVLVSMVLGMESCMVLAIVSDIVVRMAP